MQTSSKKGTPCFIKPILCQEGWCNDCQVYKDFQGYERTMGRISSLIYPIQSLRNQIQAKREEAFDNSLFGNLENQLQLQAMVNAYDLVLKLIDEGK